MSSASRDVVASRNVGPDPIIARSLPGISEIISVSERAGWIASSSRPPFTFDRCLRIVLISVMFAPEASRTSVTSAFSASVIPSAGATIKKIEHRGGGADAAFVGNGVARLEQLDPPERLGMAFLDDRAAAVEPVAQHLFQSRQQRSGRLAGADRDDPSGRVEQPFETLTARFIDPRVADQTRPCSDEILTAHRVDRGIVNARQQRPPSDRIGPGHWREIADLLRILTHATLSPAPWPERRSLGFGIGSCGARKGGLARQSHLSRQMEQCRSGQAKGAYVFTMRESRRATPL